MRTVVAAAVAAMVIGTPSAALAGETPSHLDGATAAVQAAALRGAAEGDIPGAVSAEFRPLQAADCEAYPDLVAHDPVVASACASGRFTEAARRTHCTATAGIYATDLPFGFYIGSMGFFASCLEDLLLACFGIITGVGAPPGGYGPGLPSQNTCFGSTTPWVSRHTQSYTAVVVAHTLIAGPSIAVFTLSH